MSSDVMGSRAHAAQQVAPQLCILEIDIRTLEEVTRAVHLQSGFQIRPGLWVHSCSYAAFVLNLKHVLKDSDNTRYVSAVGSEFTGRCLLLGQLVYYRTDPKNRSKFEPSAASALFAGWRLDSGPESEFIKCSTMKR